MIDKMIFIGTNVEEINYKEHSFIQGAEGSFTLEVSRADSVVLPENLVLEDHPNKSGYKIFTYGIKSSIDASNDVEEQSVAFKLSVSFNVNFEIKEEFVTVIDKSFFETNSWFFDNYAHQETNRILVGILNNTKYRSLSLMIPAGRITTG